jgi:hypothetical protein
VTIVISESECADVYLEPNHTKIADTHALRLPINGRSVVRVLGTFVLGLVLLNLATRLAICAVDGDIGGGMREVAYRFDLDRENTLAAWYSSLTLLACASLLAVFSWKSFSIRAPFAAHWACLAAGFAMMSLDESAAVHEISIVPLRRILDLHGLFYFAWVVPGACAVLGIAVAYFRFLLHLDRTTRNRFLAAGAIFVGGAMGLEAIGGMLVEWQGFQSVPYVLVSTLEETCEMVGILIFLYALIDYSACRLQKLCLCFTPVRCTD